MTRLRCVVTLSMVLFVILTTVAGCGRDARKPSKRRARQRAVSTRQANAAALFATVSNTLNSLPDEVVLELVPPIVVLDDSRSSDGKEVLATLSINPQDPEGGYGYLSVPGGNANFRSLRVKAGDILRYFVDYNTESLEHGGGVEVDYMELPVRRLDTRDPQNALILDTPLNGPVTVPHRIEVWRFSDRRMNEIRIRLARYIRSRRPAIAWEPSPDESALQQLVDRANQWFRNTDKSKIKWRFDPLVTSWPEQLRAEDTIAPLLEESALSGGLFDLAEVRSLQEAIWHRDISDWAKHGQFEKLEIAQELFDWTVRNIQLDDPHQPGIVHQPWQALLYGHGTAMHRAWVFAELCRQQGMDVVVLEFSEADSGGTYSLPALWLQGGLYLFDPRLGLPVAGEQPDRPATLAEVRARPELLRQMDLTDQQQYPLTESSLARITAYVVATPLQLSRRAKAIQQTLKGENYVILAADASRVADELKTVAGIHSAKLWPFPLEERLAEQSMKRPQRESAAQQFLLFSQRPRLWKARVLHFMGDKPIPVSQQDDPLAQPRRGHREATKLYQHPTIRLPEKVLAQFEPTKQVLYRAVKNSASYWLGLLSYDNGNYEIAEDWFLRRTLAGEPDGPWTAGATYNLARCLEQLGRISEASALLAADESPQQEGNRLRAARLEAQESGPVEPDESPSD